jgi:hypothetical protein
MRTPLYPGEKEGNMHLSPPIVDIPFRSEEHDFVSVHLKGKISSYTFLSLSEQIFQDLEGREITGRSS